MSNKSPCIVNRNTQSLFLMYQSCFLMSTAVLSLLTFAFTLLSFEHLPVNETTHREH